MSRTAMRNVTVVDPETGIFVRYLAGQVVPDHHEELITNEKVWQAQEGKSIPKSDFTPDFHFDVEGETRKPGDSHSVPVGENEEILYENLTNRELLTLCSDRGIDVDNPRKASLVEALRQHDQEALNNG